MCGARDRDNWMIVMITDEAVRILVENNLLKSEE